MGNYICTLPSAAGGQSIGPKVVLPDGGVLRLGAGPTTAAELMFDHPGHFLVRSCAVIQSRRLVALSADEELDFGVVYAVFPMDRMGSVATPADMGRLLLGAGKEARRSAGAGGRSKVIPVTVAVTEEVPERRWKLEAEVDDGLMGRLRYRNSICRPTRPVLATINEEAIC